MTMYITVVELWSVQDFFYNNEMGHNSKTMKGKQPFEYATHFLVLILITIKLHVISQMITDLWGVQEFLEKIIKGHNLGAKKG